MGPEIWTSYGKLTAMTITKPKSEGQFDDLRQWKLCMIFKEHQTKVIEIPVAAAMGEFAHIMAWYAFWRKWPIQYYMWEWAAYVCGEEENVSILTDFVRLGELGDSDEYKLSWHYVHDQEGSGYPLVNNNVDWKDKHVCTWETFGNLVNASTYLPRVKKWSNFYP